MSILTKTMEFLPKLARHRDLGVVALLTMTIVMMIIPLPLFLVDILIAVNITAAILLLMTALYLEDPVELSTFPSIILIATIFRLSLSIATTRLILAEAEAGDIINTFGEYVISGQVVVGLVIFLIITVVQFVVITKGSERVAEVSARFTLDALPGKQMSIDSDLRNEAITQEEATRRREHLQKESQFYGAMDGSMKFVKGDAIAGLIITFINLIGGIIMGTVVKDMGFGEAGHTYSILTIGDGLVAQLPALFISVASGIIITRVASDDKASLGIEITNQFAKSPIALIVAAVIALFVAMIPGFPWYIFFILSILLIAIAMQDKIKNYFAPPSDVDTAEEGEQIEEDIGAITEDMAPILGGNINVYVGTDLHNKVEESFISAIEDAADNVRYDLGIKIRKVGLKLDERMETEELRFDLEDVPYSKLKVPVDRVLVHCDNEELTLANIDSIEIPAFPEQEKMFGIYDEDKDKAIEADIEPLTIGEAIATSTVALQLKNISSSIGTLEASQFYNEMAQRFPSLVQEAQEVVPPARLAEAMRRLLDEKVSLANHRLLLEALIHWGAREQDPILLSEYVRTSFKRQLSHAVADDNKVVNAYLLAPEAEKTIREAVVQTTVGEYLTLNPERAGYLLNALKEITSKPKAADANPILLTKLDIRRFVRSFLQNNQINIPVLSFQDVAPDYRIAPIARISF